MIFLRVTPEEVARVRPVMENFAASMFGGDLALVDHQQLQQFVSISMWDHVEMRRGLVA